MLYCQNHQEQVLLEKLAILLKIITKDIKDIMNTYNKPYIIAEIGCNHKGDMQIAKELIQMAKIFCNVDAVKFQKRHNKELLTEAQYNSPHPNPTNSYGDTYGAHREYLEFDVNQHQELKDFCESIGIDYSTSVWDVTSAKEIASLIQNL